MDWYWTRNLFVCRSPSVKATEYSSSSWWSTSRRRWSDWILETNALSLERFGAISTLVWWNVEEPDGRRRRQQEKISILYWPVRTSNSLPPSSSRSFRTQSHWSHTAGQCCHSGRFLQVHLSRRMCNQFTFDHQFRIDTRRLKFKQKTDGILHVCGSYKQRTQRSEQNWLGSTASYMVQSESGRNIISQCMVSNRS